MSTERETTRIVRSWLEVGATALPDRVLDVVLDQLPATPQRRPFWRAWRFPNMNSPVRYAIAAAAVLVVALVGYQYRPASNLGSGGRTPEPTLTPSLAPTAAASAPTLPLTDSLAAGRYRPYPDLALTVDAPAGWSTCCESPAWIIHDGGEQLNAAIFFDDFTGLAVPEDPCKWSSGASSEPVGARAFADALTAQSGSATRVPEEVTVAGLPGFHVRLVVPGDFEVEKQADGDDSFLACDQDQYTFWTSPAGEAWRYAQGLNQIEDVYLVDVDDRTLAFDLSHFPRASDAHLEALDGMLASIEIN